MPISAIVLQLSNEDKLRQNAIDDLAQDSRITLGELQDRHLPAVLETATLYDGIQLVKNELPSLKGVVFVHVVSVDFSDVKL